MKESIPLPANLIKKDLQQTEVGISPLNVNGEKFVISPYLKKELLPLGLNGRLEKFLQEYPDKYDPDTISKVRTIIYYELKKPDKRRPHNLFQTINDFELYYILHPEWCGKSPTEMQADKASGAAAFYVSFNKFTQRIPDKKERLEARKRLLNIRYEDRSSLERIDDWIRERNSHWQGKTAIQILQDKAHGGQAFYAAAYKWVRTQTGGNKKAAQELMNSIFAKTYTVRDYASLDQWKQEFHNHPEWQGKTARELLKDKDSGSGVLSSIFKMVERSNKDA